MKKRLFGLDRFILSPTEYKRVLLTSELCLVFIIALIFYTAEDVLAKYTYPIPYNIAAMAVGMVVLFLNRRGYFVTARVILILAVNAIAIFFTAVLPPELGIFLFSICINLGVLAIFGLEKIKLSIFVISISFAGFLAAVFHGEPRLSVEISDLYLTTNLIFSFVLSNLATVLIIYYLMNANRQVESMLFLKERAIEQKNQELTRANIELDKFFYSASHDLRAPLTSIQGLIQLLEMTHNADELRQYVQLLKDRAINLEQFIRSISEYSGNIRQEIRHESVALRALVARTLENFRFYPNADKIKIELNIPPDLSLVTDPHRLQIILGNLISNAIKYHDFNKPAPYVRIGSRIVAGKLLLIVEDNGVGIQEDHLPKIFGMFYRVHRHAEGTGLGLYISREAVEKLDGRIEVQSTYGLGSLFSVEIPLQAVN